jgi:hypothetical protein
LFCATAQGFPDALGPSIRRANGFARRARDCNHAPALARVSRRFSREPLLRSRPDVILARLALIALPLAVFAARIHQRPSTDLAVVRDLNRCLTVVRFVAARRRAPEPRLERVRGGRVDAPLPEIRQ